MKRIFKKVRAHVKRVQGEEDHIRRSYVVWLSSLSFVVVIVGWVGYMSVIIERPDPPVAQQIAVTAEDSGSSLAQVMGSGVGKMAEAVGKGVKGVLAGVGSIFGRTHSIDVQPTITVETVPDPFISIPSLTPDDTPRE